MSHTPRRRPRPWRGGIGALLTIPLLGACTPPSSNPNTTLSVHSGVLSDGRHVERVDESVGADHLQRIEVIRNDQGDRLIGVARVSPSQAGQGRLRANYDRPERCLVTSRLSTPAAGGPKREVVIQSSCGWLPVGTRLTMQAIGLKRVARLPLEQ